MKRHWYRMGSLLVLGTVSIALVSACSSDSEEPTESTTTSEATTEAPMASTVDVTLNEWSVVAEPANSTAGEVTFNVENKGAIPHEMIIVRTDLAADALPVEDSQVDETDLDVVDEIDEFPSGIIESGTFDLEPGNYVLFCNIPAHYGQGMHTAFTVE